LSPLTLEEAQENLGEAGNVLVLKETVFIAAMVLKVALLTAAGVLRVALLTAVGVLKVALLTVAVVSASSAV